MIQRNNNIKHRIFQPAIFLVILAHVGELANQEEKIQPDKTLEIPLKFKPKSDQTATK